VQAWSVSCQACGAPQPDTSGGIRPDKHLAPVEPTNLLPTRPTQGTPTPYSPSPHGYPPHNAGYPSQGTPGYTVPPQSGYPVQGTAPSYGYPAPGYGYSPYTAPAYPPPAVVYASKSTGLAVLFNILWIGAGNIYAGQVGLGVSLIVIDFFLGVFNFFLAILVVTIPLLIITIPLWIGLFIISLVTSISAVESYNRNLARSSGY
jgi:hypothetical protein